MNTSKQLWSALNKNLPVVEFSVGGESNELPPIPGLVIKGIGDVSLPLVENCAVTKSVISICQQAPFGKGLETVLDTSVRKAWELDPSQFSFTNPNWNSGLERLLHRVMCNLIGCALDEEDEKRRKEDDNDDDDEEEEEEEEEVEEKKEKEEAIQEQVRHCRASSFSTRCSPYKLLVYEVGGHFLYHRDTEKEPGMFATMVVQLPSKCVGGNLVVKHKESTHNHDFGQSSGKAPYMAHFAAHYADLEHKVEEITSGVRVAVVYNICWEGLGPTPSIPLQDTQATLIASILEQWDLTSNEKLVICLDHQYTDRSIRSGVAGLKGTDRNQLKLLLNANAMLSPEKKLNVYLALAERTAQFSCGDGWSPEEYCEDWDLVDEAIDITSWVNVDGNAFEGGKEIKIDFNLEALNDPWSHNAVIESSFEGYTGNEGATKDTVYRRAIAVFWPAQQELTLILKHGGVSAHVRHLQSIANKYCQALDPKQKGEEMEKFRAFFISQSLPCLQTSHMAMKGIHFFPLQSSMSPWNQSLLSITSILCQVSDIVSARHFLCECIAMFGLTSDSVCDVITNISNTFGWPNVIDLILPLFSSVKVNQISFGTSLLVTIAERYLAKLGESGGILLCHYSHLMSLAASSNRVCELLKLGQISLSMSDRSFAREFISHMSKCGVQSGDIADVILQITRQFGCSSVVDLIPGLFSVLCGAEKGACRLLCSMLSKYRDVHGSVLVPILRKMMEHLIKCKAKKCSRSVMRIICDFKDANFSRKVIAEVIVPIGLHPGNSIIADATISIGHSIGWSLVKDLIPLLFCQLTSFCAESYSSLLVTLLKEDAEIGKACCSILSSKALIATSSCVLPGKDVASLIIEVFHPLDDVTALQHLVSNILQLSDANVIADLVLCLRVKVGSVLLKAEPLVFIIKKRVDTINLTISTLPVPSWKFPTLSTIPNHYTQVISFLQGNAESAHIQGFANIREARNFIQKHQKSLPLMMSAAGSGFSAYVKMIKTPQIKLDCQHMLRRSILQNELKGLHVLLVGGKEVAVAARPLGNTSTHLQPAISSNVNCGPSSSSSVVATPPLKRIKMECIEIN